MVLIMMQKSIFNYKTLLHGCLRLELNVYFYNLKSQKLNQSIWNSIIYETYMKLKIENIKNKYEKANYFYNRNIGNIFGYRESAYTQPIVIPPDKAFQLNRIIV